MKRVLYRQLFVIYIFPLRLCHCPKGNLLIQVWLYTGDLLIQVWLALARRPGLPFLTAGLPNFVTRKARQTSAYKIYPPINFTYIDEMMTFLRKSKFPMINITIILTITNENCSCYARTFLFLNNLLYRPRDIGIDQLFHTQSGFR
jgi:hypothetical protein